MYFVHFVTISELVPSITAVHLTFGLSLSEAELVFRRSGPVTSPLKG